MATYSICWCLLMWATVALCYDWSDNLYVKALKYAFPTNYSLDSLGTNLNGREMRFFPWIFHVPQLNDEYATVHMQGYVTLSWTDPQLRKWNHSLPEWNGLKRFPLTNFKVYPSSFPNINGVDQDSITLYVNWNGEILFFAKTSQYIDCYRTKESQYPKEIFQCDYDWKLMNNDGGKLTCFNTFFDSDYICNSHYNGSSYLTEFTENHLQNWIIRIKHQSLDNPPRLRFSTTFTRRVDHAAIVDHGISYYVIVVIVLQLIVHCNRIERVILGLLAIFDLLIGLASLEKLTAIRDDPSLKILIFHKYLIVIQLILLAQSIILYSAVSLHNRVPVPRFLTLILQFLYDKCLFLRHSVVSIETYNRVTSKIQQKRLNVEDYVIDPQLKKNVTVTNETVRKSDMGSGFNKGINVGFYDDDCESICEYNAGSQGDVRGSKELSWITVCWFLDILTSLVIVIVLVYFIIRFT